MTDTPDTPFLPPGLELGDDDVIETFEEVEAAADAQPDIEVELGEIAESVPERVSGFDGIGTRRESRERALALLYEAEQKGLAPMAGVIGLLPVAPEPKGKKK